MTRPLLLVFLSLLLFCASFSQIEPPAGGYYAPPPQKSVSQLDQMIDRCFRTTCKEWMLECHWYCDSMKEKARFGSCHKCLSWRGSHCLECFDL